MMKVNVFPTTTESCEITGAVIDRFEVATPNQRSWFLNDLGQPIAHPSLTDGYALVCQIHLTSGGSELWACNNLPTMRKLHSRLMSGNATAIEWYIGLAADILT